MSASDDALLTKAASDPDAFAMFYRRYERAVLAYFYRRTGDPELAADLAAEVFASVLIACGRYQPGPAPASAWLFAIAQHKLVSSWRRGRVEDRARRRLRMAPIELEDKDLARIEREAGTGTVLALLEQLPVEQREAVRARILEDHPYKEIARRLECSQAVVRKRVSRGLASLRSQLGEETR